MTDQTIHGHTTHLETGCIRCLAQLNYNQADVTASFTQAQGGNRPLITLYHALQMLCSRDESCFKITEHEN